MAAERSLVFNKPINAYLKGIEAPKYLFLSDVESI